MNGSGFAAARKETVHVKDRFEALPDDELENINGGIPVWALPFVEAMGKQRFTMMIDIMVKKGRDEAYNYVIKEMGPDFEPANYLRDSRTD